MDSTIGRLQKNLNDLGFTDARGRELVVDGIRGGSSSRTNEAIAAFLAQTSSPSQLSTEQTATELLAATQAALDARRHMRHSNQTTEAASNRLRPQVPVSHEVEDVSGPLRRDADPRSSLDHLPKRDTALPASCPFGDARHPLHDLYSELKRHLPDCVSTSRLAQFTSAAHIAGIRPVELESIDINAERAMFASCSPGAQAIVDMRRNSPPIQESLQRAEAFNSHPDRLVRQDSFHQTPTPASASAVAH